MTTLETRTRTTSIPVTALVTGQVFRWRYLHESHDHRRLVTTVRPTRRGIVYVESVDADKTDPFARAQSKQSWVYDDGDMVTVEVES